ncbi:hypothetical protein HDU67_001256 [Dinochytrium kinnereticum]|nr:hypothetical protein HDU67_001256 [Dinochytrium kinnereticum]
MSAGVRVNELEESSYTYSDENLDIRSVIIYPANYDKESPRRRDVMPETMTETESSNKRAKPDGEATQAAEEPKSVGKPIKIPDRSITPVHRRRLPPQNNDVTAEKKDGVDDSRKRKFNDDAEDLSELSPLEFEKRVVRMMFSSGESISLPGLKSIESNRYLSNGTQGRAHNAKSIPRLPPTTQSKAVISYICQGSRTAGRFDPELAAALGVRPGKQYGRLYAGESVITDAGVTVYPHQCMAPEKNGAVVLFCKVFMIVECPSHEYIRPLVHNAKFEPHFAKNTNTLVSAIVHILGDGVIDDPHYRTWMQCFGDSTQHIIIDGKHTPKPVVFHKSAMSLCRLNNIDPNIFEIPFYSNVPTPFENDASLPTKISTAQPLLIYGLEPTPKFDRSEIRKFNHLELNQNPAGRLEKFLESCNGLNEALVERNGEDHMNFSAKVYPLGTGASLPSKFRNVSSTYIHVPNSGGILLDGGEGTYGQLFRKFGPDSALPLSEVLKSLKLVFVSHMHADHHLGIFRILAERRKILNGESAPFFIVGPPKYQNWLEEYSEIEDLGLSDMTFLSCSSLLQISSEEQNSKDFDRLLEVAGLSSFRTVVVDHCPFAYACVIEHAEGWKIVFSGDCRPNQNLIRHGSNASLLIHEATFENSLNAEAKARKHCTIAEALEVAKQMNAKNILLTHFSQRTPRIPNELLQIKDSEQQANILIAFDLMGFSLSDMWKFSSFLKPLGELYPSQGVLIDGENEGEEENEDEWALSGKVEAAVVEVDVVEVEEDEMGEITIAVEEGVAVVVVAEISVEAVAEAGVVGSEVGREEGAGAAEVVPEAMEGVEVEEVGVAGDREKEAEADGVIRMEGKGGTKFPGRKEGQLNDAKE